MFGFGLIHFVPIVGSCCELANANTNKNPRMNHPRTDGQQTRLFLIRARECLYELDMAPRTADNMSRAAAGRPPLISLMTQSL